MANEALIAVHAVAAGYTLLFGAFQLLRKKGGPLHRVIGRIWVAAIYIVAITSFWVRTLNGGFSWLHALSVLTLLTVTMGLVAAIRGSIPSHKAFMMGSYFGVLGAFIGVIAVPGRRLPQMAVHDLPLLILWLAALILTAGCTVAGTARLASTAGERIEIRRTS
ncbi:DUF2306 domain-containing protein [Arthrobacter sp. UYCo732]|uniref:DUF2306 domain-containing protein n=1 Tax=Arthrobacter sp. UYCo732 TaxID=3156336 RepID=UPI0033912783